MGAGATQAERSPDVRRQILDAARDIVLAEGAEALSMRGVAARVGLSATALYHYFENKRALVDRVVETAFKHMEAFLEAAAADLPLGSWERVRAVSEGYIRFAREHDQYFKLLFTIRTDRIREMENHPAEGCYRLLLEAVARARGMDPAASVRATDPTAGEEAARPLRPHQPEMIVLYLWSYVHGLVTLSLACKLQTYPGGPQVDARELFEASWPLVLDGLRTGQLPPTEGAPA